MKLYELMAGSGIDREAAEREARKQLGSEEQERASLTAWYDRAKHTGGPMEPCAEETEKCVYDYARTHGASIRVSVNSGAYDFFYSIEPPDVVELDRSVALQVHEGLAEDDDVWP